mmetsp:Transcript_99384/g.171085  ORF Transcript_99384/g.171085 Transcript_99384/m.171085 type:complete len:295 (+) Transcript_99384:838-1722(+)
MAVLGERPQPAGHLQRKGLAVLPQVLQGHQLGALPVGALEERERADLVLSDVQLRGQVPPEGPQDHLVAWGDGPHAKGGVEELGSGAIDLQRQQHDPPDLEQDPAAGDVRDALLVEDDEGQHEPDGPSQAGPPHDDPILQRKAVPRAPQQRSQDHERGAPDHVEHGPEHEDHEEVIDPAQVVELVKGEPLEGTHARDQASDEEDERVSQETEPVPYCVVRVLHLGTDHVDPVVLEHQRHDHHSQNAGHLHRLCTPHAQVRGGEGHSDLDAGVRVRHVQAHHEGAGEGGPQDRTP